MDKLFGFQKNNAPNFEIKEEHLEQIGLCNMAKEPLCSIAEESQTEYRDKRWIDKSNIIKIRDNYTCQLCHTFNPMQGDLIFVKQGDYDTIHRYYWQGNNKYDIYVKGYILNITFDFAPNYHLAMPRLNVHHKIYYRNRNLWDYPDDCLVTLCENCHHYIHSLNNIGIPVVEESVDGHTTLIGRIQPKPYSSKIDHTDLGTFQPFSLVKENRYGHGLNKQYLEEFRQAQKENKQWFDYQDVLDNNVVNIKYFMTEESNFCKHPKEEIEKIANFIINDFIKNFLSFS